MNTSIEWMNRTTRGDATSRIAINSGMTPSTLLRHVKDGALTTDDVLRIAAAYDVPPGEALSDAGLADSPDDGDTPRLSAATDDELLAELRRRLT